MAVSRIPDFDLWRAGCAGASVTVYVAGTATLASLFTDEALTVAAANPQTLSSLTIDGVSYGKFSVPIYVGVAYTLSSTPLGQSGTIRPGLTTLTGETATGALVIPTGGSVSDNLGDLLGRDFWVNDTAVLGVSAATNSATLTTAVGRAASAGGGYAKLPDNTAIPFNQLTISQGVKLLGRGRTGTPTVLQSQVADKCVTLGGDGAGLKDVVLDGVNNVASGIGVFSKAKNETTLDNVLVKRLATGIQQFGGRRALWKGLYIDSCGIGATFQGNLDTSGGDLYTNNKWDGGKVSNCTVYGVQLTYIDKVVSNNSFYNVGFEDNTGTALDINGARFTELNNCHFSGNTVNIAIADDDLTTVTDNTIYSFVMKGGSLGSGSVNLNGTCKDVIFYHVDMQGTTFNLTNVTGNVLFIDCKENSAVTFTGNSTRIVRINQNDGDFPGSVAVTTDAVALKAWELTLQPGEKAWLEGKVIGNQRNGVGYAFYHIGRAAHRPGSNLTYDAQTVNFTLGALLTGTTSGATGRIIGDTDAGATGTLVLKDIDGVFLDNEPLTDSSGGAATCNGVLVPQNAALLGSTTSIEAAVETTAGFGADFAANAGNIELQVTGAASNTIDWSVNVSVNKG